MFKKKKYLNYNYMVLCKVLISYYQNSIIWVTIIDCLVKPTYNLNFSKLKVTINNEMEYMHLGKE